MQKRRDLFSSLVLIALGAGWVLYSFQYPLGAMDLPGPGLVPLVAGLLLIALSAQLLLSALPTVGTADRKGAVSAVEPEKAELRKPLLMLAAMGAYIFTMGWAGYLLNTFLLVLLGVRIMGGRDWAIPLLVAAGTTILTYLLFVSFLNVPLPQGQLIPISFVAR